MKSLLRLALILGVAAGAFTGGMLLQKYRGPAEKSGESRSGRFQAATKFVVLPPANQASQGPWMNNQEVIIGSREVLLRAVNRLHLDRQWNVNPDEAAARVEAKIAVERVKDTDVVTVTASDDNPATAAEIANALREGYGEHRTAVEQEYVNRVQQHLTAKVKEQESEVESRRKELIELARKHNISDIFPISTSGSSNPMVIACGPGTIEENRRSVENLGQDLRNMEAQARTIENLRGPQLVAAIRELGISNEDFAKAAAGSTDANSPELVKAAEACREELFLRIQTSLPQLEDAKKRLAEKAVDPGAERRNQSEYAAARQRYEASLMQLNNLREQAARQKASQGVPASAFETLETARPTAPLTN